MKITLISLDNWGFNSNIAVALEKKGHIIKHINFNEFAYKYPSFSLRIYNFLNKNFLNKNLKTIYYGEKIIEILKENNEIQDIILTIKADFIDPKSLMEFKKYTAKSITFVNDSIARYPKTVSILKYFDEVYSFEKEDCEKYNLKFKTNFIYNYTNNNPKISNFKYQLFNISSRDKRTSTILKIAQKLKIDNIKFKIFIFDNKYKIKENKLVTILRKSISLDEVNKYIENSQILLDIQRKKQKGLTFRVFESLGLEKKLITSNEDVKTYDFYNPNNILVIDVKNPVFPKSFFEKPYQSIPEEIINKYLVENWVETLINK
jgi:hypothetical protein